jgi:hypothetical protein
MIVKTGSLFVCNKRLNITIYFDFKYLDVKVFLYGSCTTSPARSATSDSARYQRSPCLAYTHEGASRARAPCGPKHCGARFRFLRFRDARDPLAQRSTVRYGNRAPDRFDRRFDECRPRSLGKARPGPAPRASDRPEKPRDPPHCGGKDADRESISGARVGNGERRKISEQRGTGHAYRTSQAAWEGRRRALTIAPEIPTMNFASL